jgi:S-DNA-T family DNA segregation ATPase FtsK/SpoIIIE
VSTTTTSVQTIPVPASGPGATASPLSEPAVLNRERALLHEILRLVAERSEAETKVETQRDSSGSTADSEYQKARRALIEKLKRLESEAHATDEKRRRAIIDAALQGEARAKADFAANSRKIATLFDSARDVAKNQFSEGKSDAASKYDSGQRKAAKEHAEKTKPIDDSARLADGYRTRLAVLAADYRKFKLDPEAPQPARETYDRYSDPSDELFTRLARMETPLKLVEGLIIPKSMKGAREAWVFIFVILPLLGLAFAFDSGESMV